MLRYIGSLPDHIQDILEYLGDWSVDENGDRRSPISTESTSFESRTSFEKHTKDMENQEVEIPRFLVIDLHSRETFASDNVCGSKTPIIVL